MVVIAKKLKEKKCQGCEEKFQPVRSFQKACDWKCAILVTNKQKEKKYNQETTRRKKALLSTDRKHWIKKAQVEFNKFIRLRDARQPCISCGTIKTDIKYDAGHYRTVGSMPALRFEELNCHKQCSWNCNSNLSGNIREYRIGLIHRIGQADFDWVEGPHEAKNYTIEDIKNIHKHYQQECKKLQALENEDTIDIFKESEPHERIPTKQ